MSDYDTHYSDWAKLLAANYTAEELSTLLPINERAAKRAAYLHLRAIEKSTSMQSNSQARAQSRSYMAMLGDKVLAINGALEIHRLFPDKAKA